MAPNPASSPTLADLSTKVALVTGAGSGIGKAVTERFVEAGARVVLAGRTVEKLERVAARLPPESTLVARLSHEMPDEVDALLSRVTTELGRLDVLVNNAGIYSPGTVANTPIEEWQRTIDIDLTGPYLMTRSALPLLRRTRGSIVNVSSTLGLRPIPSAASYCVAKAALVMLTQVTAIEEAESGVRVNAVCPGVVQTPIHAQRIGDDPDAVAAFSKSMGEAHPLGRVGTPEEIAALVAFLCSEHSAWTTGSVITIDGGISLA